MPDVSYTGLPADVEAERNALGMVLFDPDVFLQLSAVLGQDDFSIQPHRHIYAAMEDIHKAGGIPDTSAVFGKLSDARLLQAVGGIEYLSSLYDPLAGVVVGFDQLCRRVKDKSVLRQFILRFSKLQDQCLLNGDSRAVIEQAESALRDLSATEAQDRRLRTAGQIVAELGGLDAFFAHNEAVAKTGLKRLDYILGGGFREEELILLAARPGYGKTALADQIAEHNAANDVATAVFSLEMSNKETLNRMICSMALVDSNQVRHNRTTSEQRRALAGAMSKLADLPLYFDDTAAATVAAIHAALRRLVATGSLGLVVIDYLQLMDAPGRGNRTEQISSISRGLKLLAKEFHVPVLALSQLTREGIKAGERPQLHHLRESGSLEQDANTVIFLHPTIDDMKTPIRPTDAIVAKQRNGPIADVPLLFHKQFTKFEEDLQMAP